MKNGLEGNRWRHAQTTYIIKNIIIVAHHTLIDLGVAILLK